MRPNLQKILKEQMAVDVAAAKMQGDEAVNKQKNLEDKMSKENPTADFSDQEYLKRIQNEELSPEELQQADDRAMSMQSEQMAPASSRATQDINQETEGTYGPAMTQMSPLEKTGMSLMKGTADNIIAGTGDALLGLGLAVGYGDADGTMLSRWLQDAKMPEKLAPYTSKKYRDMWEKEGFSTDLFAQPDFWTVDIAQLIPQAIEMIYLSKGMSGGLRTGVSKGLKALGGVKKLGAAERLAGGVAKANIELGKTGSILLDGIGGGAIQNQLVAAQNSGQLVMDLKRQGGYSDEALGEIAASNYANTSKYMAIDMLSWGVSFGLGGKSILKGAKNLLGAGTKTSAEVSKAAAQQVAKATRPIWKKVITATAKAAPEIAGKMAFEGFEEAFQETWEDWSQLRAKQKYEGKAGDVHLSEVATAMTAQIKELLGGENPYKGAKDEFPSYMSYFFSERNKKTKVLSAVVGGLVSGGAHVLTNQEVNFINDQADMAHKLYTESDVLKNKYKSIQKEDRYENSSAQLTALEEKLIDNAYEISVNQDENAKTNQQIVNDLIEREILDEETGKEALTLADNIDEAFDESIKMNVNGKFAYTQAKLKAKRANENYELRVAQYNEKKAKVEELYTEEKAKNDKLKEIKDEFDLQAKALMQEYAINTTMTESLLMGKILPDNSSYHKETIDGVDFIVGGLTDEQYRTYYELTDQEIFEHAQKEAQKGNGKGSFYEGLSNKMKSVYNKALDVFSKEDTKENPTNKEQVNEQPKEQVNEEVVNEQASNKEPVVNKDEPIVSEEELKATETETVTPEVKAEDTTSDTTSDTKQDVKIEEDGNKTESKIEDNTKEVVNTPENKENTTSNNTSTENDTSTQKEVKEPVYDTKSILDDEENLDAAIQMAKTDHPKVKFNDDQHALYYKKKALYNDKKKYSSTWNQEAKDINNSLIKNIERAIDTLNKIETKESIKKTKNKKVDPANLKTSKTELVKNAKVILYNKINSQQDLSQWLEHNLPYEPYEARVRHEAFAVTKKLAQLYPGKNINVYAMKSLADSLGKNGWGAIGLAMGGSIFIQTDVWDQGTTYMHEFSHIYYNMDPNSKEILDILKEAKKDKNFIDNVKRTNFENVWYTPNKTYQKDQSVSMEKYNYEDIVTEMSNKVTPNDPSKGYSRAEVEAFIENNFDEAPFEEQDVIREEVFANYMQGPLSKKYNNFFREQNAKEIKRKKLSKTFWNELKNSNLSEFNGMYFIENYNDQGAINSKEALISTFIEKIADFKGEINGALRYSKTNIDNEIAYQNNLEKIRNDFAEVMSDDNYLGMEILFDKRGNPGVTFNKKFVKISEMESLTKELQKQKELKEDANLNAAFIYNPTSERINPSDSLFGNANENSNIDWDHNWRRSSIRAGKIVTAFWNKHQAKMREEVDQLLKENPDIVYNPIKERMFKSKLFKLAHNYSTFPEFINAIVNAPKSNIEMNNFNEFLETNFGKYKVAILRSMYMIYHSTDTYNVISYNINDKGGMNFDQNLNAEERQISNFINDNLTGEDNQKARDKIIKLGMLINANNYNEKDVDNFIKEFTKGLADVTDMLADGFLYYNDVLVHKDAFVKYHLANLDLNSKTPFKSMVTDILVSNRRFTSDYIVDDVSGNQTSSKHLTNSISQLFSKIKNQLKSYGTNAVNDNVNEDTIKKNRNEFIKEYSNISGTNNDYLGFVFDEYMNDGILPDLTMLSGIKNDITEKSIQYKNADSQSMMIGDVMAFIKSVNNKSNGWTSNLSVFGNSKRRFMLRQKVYSKKDTNIKDVIKSIYKINTKSIGGLTATEWNKYMQEAIDDTVKYFNDNNELFAKYDAFKGLYDKKGKLTSKGVEMLSNYELSTIINKHMLHELTTPNIPIYENTKRNKMNGSPFMKFTDNMHIENIIMSDERMNIENTEILNNDNLTKKEKELYAKMNDSGQYITQATADKLTAAGAGVIDLRRGFKLVNYNVIKNNPKFNGKVMALKGYTTIINEEMAAKYPRMKQIYDMLTERENRFDMWNSKYNKGVKKSQHYGDGGLDYIAIASPMSSMKTNIFSESQLKAIDDNGGIFSLKSLEDKTNLKRYHDLMDKIHYESNGGNPRAKFNGFQSDSFGVQMRMDDVRTQIKVPSQISAAIMSTANTTEQLAKSEKIIAKMNDAIQAQWNETLGKDMYLSDGVTLKNGEQLFKALYKYMDKSAMSEIEKRMFETEVVSIYNPMTKESALNLMSNLIAKYSNNLKNSGTLAQQRSEIVGKIVGGKQMELQGYTMRKDGTFNPMEAVVPQYMDGKVQQRKTGSKTEMFNYLFKNRAARKRAGIRLAVVEMKDIFGIGRKGNTEIINNYLEENAITVDGQKIYSVPGDKIIVTRVPSSGPAFTGVAEVIGFDLTGASTIMVPTEFKSLIGSDDDGDQLFVNTWNSNKDGSLKSTEYNKFLDLLSEQWLSKEFNSVLSTPLKSVEEVDEIIKRINQRLGIDPKEADLKGVKKLMPFSSKWNMQNINNSLAASNTIGIMFNLHRTFNTISAYSPELNITEDNGVKRKVNITIDGKQSNTVNGAASFTNKQGLTRLKESESLSQIALDSEKNAQTAPLNINRATADIAMILSNLGFDLETIGMFLNQDIVKKYSNKMLLSGSVLADFEFNNEILNSLYEDVTGKTFIKNVSNFDINFDNSEATQKQTIEFLNYLNNLNNNIDPVRKLISSYKNIDNDPLLINDLITDYDNTVDNKNKNSTITFNPSMKNNPELIRYRNTLKKASDLLSHSSIIMNKGNISIYKHILDSVYIGIGTNERTKFISKLLKDYENGKILGLNRISTDVLNNLINIKETNIDGKLITNNNVYDSILEWANENIEDFNENTFFQKVLRVYPNNNNVSFSLQPIAKQNNLTNKELNQIKNDFLKLPVYIQKQIIKSDYLLSQWSNKNTIFPYLPDTFISAVNRNANKLNELQNTNEYTEDNKRFEGQVEDAIINIIMANKDIPFKKITLPKGYQLKPKYTESEKLRLTTSIVQGVNRYILDEINENEGKPYYVSVVDKFGEVQNVKLSGIENINPNIMQRGDAINKQVKKKSKDFKHYKSIRKALLKQVNGQFPNIEFVYPQINDPNMTIDLLSRKSSPVPTQNIDDVIDQMNSKKKGEGPKIRKSVTDTGNYQFFQNKNELSPDAYSRAINKPHISNVDMAMKYDRYLRHKEEANEKAKKYTPKYLRELSLTNPDKLNSLYNDWSKKDAYAYSIILAPLHKAILSKTIHEQMSLHENIKDGDRDMNVMRAWFQTNNISKDFPGSQYIQKEIEKGHKEYMREKRKYTGRLRKVTDALFQEKFNDRVSGNKFVNKLFRAAKLALSNRVDIYEQLYGNIIENTEDSNGNITRHLKKESDLRAGLDNGSISQVEYNYAKEYRTIIKELAPFRKTTKLSDSDYDTFIPAVSMGRMEAFANRGLLGLLTNSKFSNEQVYDVKLNFKGNLVTFKEIEDYFRKEAPANNYNEIKEYLQYKKKAKSLLKQFKNEDGSAFEMSDNDSNSFADDGMMERFAGSPNINGSELYSMDLDKAIHQYVHNTLFINGNGTFKGFKRLQPIVDALLTSYKEKGYTNAYKHALEVYKEGYLNQKRNRPKKTRDKVIDGLVKGNLLYILGWKGLALKHGIYAVGNMVVGKYHNVKNRGGKEWWNGEKRFWGLNKGDAIGTKKALGVLKTLDFQNFSVYDEVEMEGREGLERIFNDIALMPMIKSEKWIQGVHFIGMLTEEQWNMFDENGEYKTDRRIEDSVINQMESEVGDSHGKGYKITDQRLIQQYSMGRAMMQFSRYIPTMYFERFGKEDVDIYGHETIGSLRATADVLFDVIHGKMSIEDFAAYKRSLSPTKRKQLESGMRGLAMSSVAAFMGFTLGSDMMKDLFGDANIIFNGSKFEWHALPATVQTARGLIPTL